MAYSGCARAETIREVERRNPGRLAPQHVVVETDTPAPLTLATMGRVANQASDTFAFREWAARLATKAKPRDYRGQLRALYDGVLRRWRYVQEPDEWIHGTPASLIRHVLGTKYNGDPDPLRASLDDMPADEKGWGDCDDVATVIAAGARALGMRPFFRVARGPAGAHVSVLVLTPDGQHVSVDPVGHPRHPFGWALRTDETRLFDLTGGPVSAGAMRGVDMQNQPATFYTDYRGRPFAQAKRAHWAAIHPSDTRGPRALAIPMRQHRLLKFGVVTEGCPAYDDFGSPYTYDANRDLWIDDRLLQTRLGGIDEAYGGVRRRRKRRARRAARRRRPRAKRRRTRRQKRRATIRRAVRRVAKPIRKISARLSKSPLVQQAASKALMAVGVPPQATRAVLEASGHILEKGGIPALVRLLRRDPRAAARLVAQAAKAGLRRAMPGGGIRLPGGFGAVDAPGTAYMLNQGDREFFAQPIVALAGVPGLYELGALEVASTPTPGQWYRIQRRDVLLKVAERAWGDKGTRGKHSKWINAVKANAVYHRPSESGFERNYYGPGIISFAPAFSDDPEAAIAGQGGNSYAVIFIPEAPGDEPPEIVPDVVEPDIEPDIEPEVEPDIEVEPDVVVPDLPPIEPIEPIEPDVDVTEDDVVEPAIPTEQERCEERGGTWQVQFGVGRCMEACPPGMINTPDGNCIPDPLEQAKQACEAGGGLWNDIRNECEKIPTGPGDCPPGTEWDEDEQDCFIPDEPDVVVPPIEPIEPDVGLPDLPDVVVPDLPPIEPVMPTTPGQIPSIAILGMLLFALGELEL